MAAESKAFVLQTSSFPLPFILPLVNIFLLLDNAVRQSAPTAHSRLIVEVLQLMSQYETKRKIRSPNVLAGLYF